MIFYAAARILSGLMMYAIFLSAIYGLGKQEYQYFSTSYPLFQVLTLTCFGWIAVVIPALFTDITGDRQRHIEARLIRAFLWMCPITIAILAAIRLAGGSDVPWPVLAAVGVAIVAVSASDDVLALANSRERPRDYLLVSVVRYGVALLLVLPVFVLPAMGAAGILAAIACGAAVSVWLWFRRSPLRLPDEDRVTPGDIVRLLAMGLPAMIAFSVYPLSMAVSRLTIAQVCSMPAATAIGGVNDLLSGPILLVFQVINLAMNPRIYGAANRGDMRALRRAALLTIGLQFAVALPLALALVTLGHPLGDAVLGSRLGPLAPQVLPFVGLSVLLSVALNTATGIALARRKATLMVVFGVTVIATAAALALYQRCDIHGFSIGFTALMGTANVVGLFLVYWLTRQRSAG